MADDQTPKPAIPPVVKTMTVRWDQPAAFARFTDGIADWWPLRTHSIGGKAAERCVFEGRVGGRIYEVEGGREHEWGQVLRWEPTSIVAFTWHPGRPADTAQEVEVRFEPVAAGTRVTLTHTGWERWGAKAPFARDGYDLGWELVLGRFRAFGRLRRIAMIGGLLPRLGVLALRSRLAGRDVAEATEAATT